MAQATIDQHEVRTMVRRILREELEELLDDPDVGRRLKPAIQARLKRDQQRLPKRTYSTQEVLDQVG